MSDIFGYFREHTLRTKLKEINYDKIISDMLKAYCENLNTVNIDEITDFENKLILIGFDPETVIDLYDENADRNNGTHIIKSRYYKDKNKMLKCFEECEIEINKMNLNHKLYYLKDKILEFINKLKLFL
jgi:DUF438 domain-containing protein